MYEFVNLTFDELDAFSKQYENASFVQSKSMALLQKDQNRQDQNRQVVAYGVKEAGKLVAAGLFSMRKVLGKYTIAHCNQGPLIDFENLELLQYYFDHVKADLKQYHCIHLLVTPNFEVFSRDIEGEKTGEVNHLNWIKHLNKVGVKHLGFDNSKINGIGRWLFIKDFSNLETEDDLMASFDHSTRKAIRKTIKDQIEVYQVGLDEIDEFKKLTKQTSKRRDFKDRSLDYYYNLKRNFGDNCKVYLAKFNVEAYINALTTQSQELEAEISEVETLIATQNASKKIMNRLRIAKENLEVLKKRLAETEGFSDEKAVTIGGVIYIVHGRELTALFAGNDDKYFGFNGTHAIHSVAMREALSEDLERFNFYGTSGKFSGHDDDGIYRFKKGFGGYILEQPGNFELPIIPWINRLYHFSRKFRR